MIFVSEEKKASKKNKFRISEGLVNALLIFILGVLVGISVKTEAKKVVTIGYEDYKISGLASDFDLMSEEEIEETQNGSQTDQSQSAEEPENIQAEETDQ